MPTVYIIIYSLYHHIYKVAKDVQKGLEAEGVTVKLFQVEYPYLHYYYKWC
jgi:multimeric flavodoxin WrbA